MQLLLFTGISCVFLNRKVFSVMWHLENSGYDRGKLGVTPEKGTAKQEAGH